MFFAQNPLKMSGVTSRLVVVCCAMLALLFSTGCDSAEQIRQARVIYDGAAEQYQHGVDALAKGKEGLQAARNLASNIDEPWAHDALERAEVALARAEQSLPALASALEAADQALIIAETAQANGGNWWEIGLSIAMSLLLGVPAGRKVGQRQQRRLIDRAIDRGDLGSLLNGGSQKCRG